MEEDGDHGGGGGGFNDRVDKIFGSISSSKSSSSSLWSLTDAQIERRVWNPDTRRRDDDQIPVSSSFDNSFNRQTKSLEDDNENDDDWDIRSSIGLDSTLDNEEEEDTYDKMAEGRENDNGDRLYMKDVTHHGPYLNSFNVSIDHHRHVDKDPPANHDTAKTRLQQDDATHDEPMFNVEQVEEEPPCVTVTVSPPDDGIRIKSILKRKSDEVAKPEKRVRFDPTCKNNDELQLQGSALPQVSENVCSVPDYILNPSKYTRYDFDDNSHDDVNERSNRDVYLGFLEQVKKSKHVVGLEQKSGESSAVLPKSVVFIPRKKRGDAAACNCVQQQPSTGINAIGIAALEGQQQDGGEISEMQEEDESHVCTKARFQTPGRRYRSKMEEDDTVC